MEELKMNHIYSEISIKIHIIIRRLYVNIKSCTSTSKKY